MGDPLGDGAWTFRLYHKPFVRWIWFGTLLMAIGGLLAATDRRYRVRARARTSPAADPVSTADPAPGSAPVPGAEPLPGAVSRGVAS